VTRSDAEAEALARDLRSFARLTGAFDSDQVAIFPALDADPYDGLAAHLGAVCERVRSLWRLTRGRTRITVIPARALLVPLPPASLLEPYFVTVREGERFLRADDPGWFVSAGYRRVDLVSEPGEFSRRGGILDIFAPILDKPIRIELESDVIVSLRYFNPADQRSTGRAEAAPLSPARETILGPPEIANLRSALAASGKGPAARRLIEALETQGEFPGMEACARLIYPGAEGLLDYIATASSRAPLVACDELDLTLEELRQHRAELLRAAMASGGGTAEALPPPDSLLLPPERIEAHLAGAPIQIRQLAIMGEEEGAAAPARHVIQLHASSIPTYRGRMADLMKMISDEIAAGRTLFILMKSEGRVHRMKSLLADSELAAHEMSPGGGTSAAEEEPGRLLLAMAEISGGFTIPEAGLTVIAEQEVFGEEVRHRKRSAIPTFASDFRDLNPGDLVVHVDHGVGCYEGLSRVGSDGYEIDVMVLSYQGKDRLFIPVTRLDLVQKYSGVGGRAPTLDRLGGTGWLKTKQRVKKAMQEMAAELLNLYAARKAVTAHSFSGDTDWQHEFEAAFPYELTTDQQIALNEIKRDLEGHTPMDRLLCGDVGFGKTEVALRAAFKVVMEGKQVAVLAPTTVLVFQHLNTIRERFAAFPSRIESLSRFKSPKEQKLVLAGLATGAVDLVIGTHRMLSADVAFKDLGLLVVDEEQRFGVAHKERIKKLRKDVHVLTLTATPIPRTLQMSLMGVRDLSVIETPPENRLAIQTHLLPFKEQIIAAAIHHELARDGQIYFVHNRIESVYAMASLLKRLVPEAEIGVAHGQMPERELEESMLKFLRGDFNVLVSTTIIENGLDIPRVNTLIVNRADHFGLSQLYQLRGRIGRSDRQAYAYLLVPPERTLTEQARKRLKALQEFSELGSGFRIAAMDLEIRGAGNLLGPHQHGHIAALGFELYCRMLERAVAELKEGAGEIPEFRATINLGVDLKIPEAYIADEHHRLMFYKKIASASAREDLERIREEMEDRYGRLPRQGLNLLEVAGLRILAERLKVGQFDYRAGSLTVRFDEGSPVEPEMILRFVRRRSDATFSPPAVLRIKGDRPDVERLAVAREVLTALA
jgi:transcription-repair coupling factor (superfamily II helicase)